ncbi:MAG: NADPH-dependent FMN reductase [Flavobacteriales bacterium]|jgi:NAD(P)H-dependent FMN reductase|tara:strand:+ start:287 stop:814 length:528 start_codon:yes stop_codon:yes gene_type:complete
MISVISSTNRKNSISSVFAKSICELLNESKIDNKVLNLNDLPDDFIFNNEVFGVHNERLLQIQDNHITDADKFIFILPEYNGSFPGAVKSFIDSFSPSRIHNKKALLIGISAGRAGNIRGLEHFTGILNYLRITVSPVKPAFAQCHTLIDEKLGLVNDENTLAFLKTNCEEFIEF